MPLPWIVNLLVAAWLTVEGWKLATSRSVPLLTGEEWIFAAGMLASAAVMPALILTTHGITNRYLADFFPASAVGVALGARVILPALALMLAPAVAEGRERLRRVATAAGSGGCGCVRRSG